MGEYSDDIGYEIQRHIGIVREQTDAGWTKELNIVSWNGAIGKYDIREWDNTHTRMSRGITLTSAEAENLYQILKKEFESES